MPAVPTFKRFPHLAWIELIKNMGPAEVFETSLINSQLSDLIIHACYLKAKVDIRINKYETKITFRSCLNGKKSAFVFKQWGLSSTGVDRNFDDCVFRRCSRKKNSLVFMDGMDKVLDRLLRIFSIQKLGTVSIGDGYDDDYKEIQINLDVITKLYNACGNSPGSKIVCENLDIDGYYDEEGTGWGDLIDYFLDGITATESVDVYGSGRYVHPTMFSAKQVFMSHYQGFFLRNAFENAKCEEILVKECINYDRGLNSVVKMWLAGKIPNLKVVETEACDDNDGVKLWELHDDLPMMEERSNLRKDEYVTEGTGRRIDCREGEDVRRDDGKIGTIVRRENYFAFVVWN